LKLKNLVIICIVGILIIACVGLIYINLDNESNIDGNSSTINNTNGINGSNV